jgi:hypothetical protein
MGEFLRYDRNNVIGKGALIVLADASVAPVPDLPKDVIGQVDPYDPKVVTGAGAYAYWLLGATTAPPTISRNVTVAGLKIQEDTGDILKEPTATVDQLSVSAGEFRPEVLELFYQGSIAEAITAGVKQGGGTKITAGGVDELSEYRIGLIVKKSKKQGVVTEGASGVTRGAFLSFIALRGSLAGDNAQTSFDPGTASALPMTFDLNPDPDADNKRFFWAVEDAPQTIALT